MISYCTLVYRARYFFIQAEDLARKTTVPYEILVWINSLSPDLEFYIQRLRSRGIPIRIVGSTPENIGMTAFRELFRAAKYDMIVQMDDDVLSISRHIAQKCAPIFDRNPKVKQLVADVIQDPFTTGARPGMESYQVYNLQDGLFDGAIDGWFSVYHRSALDILLDSPFQPYFYLGTHMWFKLKSLGMMGALCTKIKVFHACGPVYAQLFDLFQFEVEKFSRLGKEEMSKAYSGSLLDKNRLLDVRVQYLKNIEHLEKF